MTTFLRLLEDTDKRSALIAAVHSDGASAFEVDPVSFRKLPGAPFAYWVTDAMRAVFGMLPPFESSGREARRGPSTCDDARYVRCWWEVDVSEAHGLGCWRGFAKGGSYSPFYADIHLVVDWEFERSTFLGFFGRPGREIARPESVDLFFRPGITWPRRTSRGISPRAMPAGCIFADKGPSAFVPNDDSLELLAVLALFNSRPFGLLVELQLAAAGAAARSYEAGIVQRTPTPCLSSDQRQLLAKLARHAWSLRRSIDTTSETSHAFLLPAELRDRLGAYDPPAVQAELAQLQAEIDAVAFDLYGLEETDRQVEFGEADEGEIAESEADENEDDEDAEAEAPTTDALMSWAVGVAFGRFDWRLAVGERVAPPEPEPFDPLPTKSPGMLPDGAPPFHAHAGILVDEPGHPHDLSRLVEEVLERVKTPVPSDVRRWLQREFFPVHLQQYSKSRRKAPIYWPLATESGSYTLWIYYPTLNDQTLYRAVNDLVEPKLKQISAEAAALRARGKDRSRDEERQLETLQALEVELTEFRETLLKIAAKYHPDQDDGVQITAAPLWPLFRHKTWQKVLKDTWAKLEKGEYDWAHLAMSYWPERVREKCKTDKSLAVAHGLEDAYADSSEPTRGRVRSKK